MVKRVIAAAAAGLMLLGTVASASADAKPGKAGCIGQIFSNAQPENGGIGQQIKELPPGLWGEAVSTAAKRERETCNP